MKRGLSETCYGFFSTLANPTRLAILEVLLHGEMNVSEIAHSLKQEQSMISHNLDALEYCSLVTSERRGKERIYNANKEIVEGIFGVVERHAAQYCRFHGSCPRSQ